MRELEEENNRFETYRGRPVTGSRHVAGRHQAKALRPARKRKLAAEMMSEWSVSQRRACRVLQFDPTSYRYKSRRRAHATLEAKIKEIVKAKLRDDRTEAARAHETWAMNFVHDQIATGTELRVLTIVDLYSRFSPAIDPRLS